jgi:hypothetical protein
MTELGVRKYELGIPTRAHGLSVADNWGGWAAFLFSNSSFLIDASPLLDRFSQ